MSRGSIDASAPKLEPVAPGAKVTWLELFFDLVFVYAFIRVTATASAGPAALLSALLILALLWFLWVTSTALGNIVRADEGIMPFASLASVVVIFIAALVTPQAFSPNDDLRSADFLFTACYLLVRLLQVLVYWRRPHQSPHPRAWWIALALPPPIGTVLLLAAASAPAYAGGAQVFAVRILLGLTVAAAFGISMVFGLWNLERISVRHWTDRFAQIVLIALGESIISVGTGHDLPAELLPTWPVVVAPALGIVVIAMLAWAYFDTRYIVGEHALRHADGRAQAALARDGYIFLHLPMISGILLFSTGLRETLDDVDGSTLHFQPASTYVVCMLYGGVALYVAALLGFQLRIERRADWVDAASRSLLLAMIPVAVLLPAIAALALLVLVLGAGLLVGHARAAERRREVRRTARERERAVEAAEAHGQHPDRPAS